MVATEIEGLLCDVNLIINYLIPLKQLLAHAEGKYYISIWSLDSSFSIWAVLFGFF